MEAELDVMEGSMVKSSSSSSIRDETDIRYTSLKDVLMSLEDSPDAAGGSSGFAAFHSSIHDFDSSAISIKNQLVKHAASAYLQSAAIVAARDQDWFGTVWGQSEREGALRSRWQGCVNGPLGFCFGLMMRTLRRMLARAAAHNVVNRSSSSAG